LRSHIIAKNVHDQYILEGKHPFTIAGAAVYHALIRNKNESYENKNEKEIMKDVVGASKLALGTIKSAVKKLREYRYRNIFPKEND